ncbi:reverse transcriptase domain-containing protein [Tanacetum coccineum]
MRPPGFNQSNLQSNQSRYQGNNFNSNQNRQGAVYQAPPYQPPTNQPLVNQAFPPVSQIQGVSKTDFESYSKANDANMNNVQMKLDNFQRNQNDFQRSYNDSQKKQDDFQNMMLSFMQNYRTNTASSSNSGTLPSQTITNPREHVNAITTRSGKTLEGPSTPLVPTPDVSIPSKEPEQNPETSTEKVQNPNLENTAHVPPPEEEDSIFIEIPKPKAKKTVNVEIQDLNSPKPTSYQPKLPYPEMMKVRENDKPSAQHSRFLKIKLEAGALTSYSIDHSSDPLPNRSLRHPMGIAEDVVVRVDGFTFLADFVVVNFVPDPRVPVILGRPFLRTAKALIDLYEETLTLRVGKEELVYYVDKSEKNEEKKSVHAISVIDFSKDDPFCGSTTIPSDVPFPSSSPMKTSDSTFEKFTDEFTLPNSLPPGNDVSIHKKDIHGETFSNPLFEFDDSFKSSDVNPLFEENDKDVEIKSSSLHINYTGQDSSREYEDDDDKVSSQIPIDTIVVPIRITFDNPIDFNDHFSKPKDFKKDLTIAFDSTDSSILPPPLLDSDSPFTAELSASVTLNSLGNEDKVFKPGILVYHTIHDKNLVTLEKNLRENISSGTLLFFKEPSFPRPPPEPPDVCMRFKPILAMKNDFVKPNEDFYLSKTVLSLNVEDVDSFTFIIWTFLPYFTYTEESPLFISFRSEDFVFDPGIVTFHFSYHKPVAIFNGSFLLLSLRTNDSVGNSGGILCVWDPNSFKKLNNSRYVVFSILDTPYRCLMSNTLYSKKIDAPYSINNSRQ